MEAKVFIHMAKYYEINSPQNKTFQLFVELLSSKGIRSHKQAFLFGEKIVTDTLLAFPDRCIGLLRTAKPANSSPELSLNHYILNAELFRILDIFGTQSPILLVKVPDFAQEFSINAGSRHLIVPFQEPGNVGATLRSAAAFGVTKILLTEGAAHPFHPKSARAASGTLFNHQFSKIPALDLLQNFKTHFGDTPTVALDLHGENLQDFKFPESFILIPGLEGSGVPKNLKPTFRIRIPMNAQVESLNGPMAVSIALYQAHLK